jgi:eukaryotic-like serine/threonine-protein kinase
VAAKLARFSWVPGGLAAALLIAVGRLAFSTSSAPLELATYDRVLRQSQVAPSKDIVLVTIDDTSIAKLGEWPWPRDVHANMLDRLRGHGARVVAFTAPLDTAQRTSELEKLRAALALLESSNLGRSEQAQQLRRLLGESGLGSNPDAHLAQAISAHHNVVLPIALKVGEQATASTELPAKFLPRAGDGTVLRTAMTAAVAQSPATIFTEAASGVGHTYLHADDDGRVRSDVAAIRVGNVLVPSLSTAIATRAMGFDASDLVFNADGALNILGRSTPLEDGLRIRPYYFAPSGVQSFEQYPYWQVLAGEVPREKLRDKVVIIGFMNTNAARDSAVSTPSGAATPELVAVASGASSLLTGTIYSRPTFAVALEWAVSLGVIAFAALGLPAAGLGIGVLATVLIIVLLAVSEIGLLSSMHVWVRMMLPCAALVAGLGLYLVGELLRRANFKNESVKDASGNLRELGQTFQKQGQLDLAFETYQRCPLDAPTMELLYYLGMDFERRAQLQKAAAVYGYIATRDPNYRDLRTRRARVREEPLTRAPTQKPPPLPMPAAPPRRRIEREVPDDPFAAPRPPTHTHTLGRYEIERELGKGAMGIVYLGRDPKINRVVAIKAIPLAEEFEEDDLIEARARFFREAEMAGRLNHPAIVTVHDAGEDQGLAYIAMEYLRGQHLSHYTDPSRLLPYKNVMWLASRVAEALHYAHRQNVVHRDIKPANIMFNPDTDELKITDFGIARLTDTSRTKTGIVLGTPSFMSPEQLEGRPIDGRSDQFALGVSLYQLLCGQLPFRAESMPRLMQKIAMEPHASVRLVRPELPECIDPIIDRVLSKSADDRYANCGELAAALRACAGPLEAPRSAEPKHEWLIP